MSQLTKISVRGFKSIQALEDFDLRPLNVLVGANGAGKSNFLGAFRLISELVASRLQTFVQKEGGPDRLLFRTRRITPRLWIELHYRDLGYRCALIPTQDNRLIFALEELRSSADLL